MAYRRVEQKFRNQLPPERTFAIGRMYVLYMGVLECPNAWEIATERLGNVLGGVSIDSLQHERDLLFVEVSGSGSAMLLARARIRRDHDGGDAKAMVIAGTWYSSRGHEANIYRGIDGLARRQSGDQAPSRTVYSPSSRMPLSNQGESGETRIFR